MSVSLTPDADECQHADSAVLDLRLLKPLQPNDTKPVTRGRRHGGGVGEPKAISMRKQVRRTEAGMEGGGGDEGRHRDYHARQLHIGGARACVALETE